MQQEAGEETRLLKEKDGESRAGSSKALRNMAARSAPPPAARLPAQTAGSKRIARAHRRDVEKAELPEQWTGRLSMYCVCTSFNIPMVFRFFRGHPSYYTRRLGQDVVHVWKILGDDVSAEEVNTDTNRDAVWWSGVEDHYSRSAEIFIFSYGVISTWGLSEGGEWDILEALKPFQERTFETPEESEYFDYAYSEAGLAGSGGMGQLLKITENVIYLAESVGTNTEESVPAKLAVSYGLAQSAKLATFETSVDSIFDRVGHLPVVMAQTGHLNLTDRAILELSGELLAYSAYINLQTDVLDTPDWFWDNEAYEPLYEKVARYLDVRHRAEIVNQRLGVLSDMYALFRDERHILYGHRLEWIVIWLIIVEIVLDLLELAVLYVTGK